MSNHPEVSVRLAVFIVVGGVVIHNPYQYFETTRRPSKAIAIASASVIFSRANCGITTGAHFLIPYSEKSAVESQLFEQVVEKRPINGM